MPNANQYGDFGCDTLGHIDLYMRPFKIDTLMKLGLNNLHPLQNAKKPLNTVGYQARMLEVSYGKDTMTGHL